MSSKVAFQIHYGDFYRITYNSYGVNLSALERRQCSLDKPLERSFESIRKCLHRMFNVNPKTHLLTVHTLTSWETNGDFWELTPISSTPITRNIGYLRFGFKIRQGFTGGITSLTSPLSPLSGSRGQEMRVRGKGLSFYIGGGLPPGRGAAGSRQGPPRKKNIFIYI